MTPRKVVSFQGIPFRFIPNARSWSFPTYRTIKQVEAWPFALVELNKGTTCQHGTFVFVGLRMVGTGTDTKSLGLGAVLMFPHCPV